MARLTSASTDRRRAAAAALVAAVAAGALATVEPAAYSLLGVTAVVVTAGSALLLDAFGGIVVGLAAAAVTIAAQRVTGVWTAERFGQSLGFTLCVVALGWLAGLLAARLRARPGESAERGALRPAFGSLGLLPEDAALARLEDEILRSRRHRRPLCVLVLRVAMDGQESAAVRAGATRAVGRVLETLLRDTDVPFALAPHELGAILPETGPDDAWDLLGPILDAAATASFAVRDDGERRSVAELAELHAGLVALRGQEQSADELLAAAVRSALADERSAGEGEAAAAGDRV